MSGSSPLSGHLRSTGLVKRDLSSVYVLIVTKEIFSSSEIRYGFIILH